MSTSEETGRWNCADSMKERVSRSRKSLMHGEPVSIAPLGKRAFFRGEPALHLRAAAFFVAAFSEAEACCGIPELARGAHGGTGVVDFSGYHRESRCRPPGERRAEIRCQFGGSRFEYRLRRFKYLLTRNHCEHPDAAYDPELLGQAAPISCQNSPDDAIGQIPCVVLARAVFSGLQKVRIA